MLADVMSLDIAQYDTGFEPALLFEVLDPSASRSANTSAIIHAVVSSLREFSCQSTPSIHAMPSEILLRTFGMLDPRSLCRLAQVSLSCRVFADDAHVWQEVSAGQ